jgi:Mg-chelatase subunit ChlI
MALAARAHAALAQRDAAAMEDIVKVAPLTLVHRRAASESGDTGTWGEHDDQRLQKALANA